MIRGTVKWNGNHYFSGDEVKGSKIKQEEDGTWWLFDDEEYSLFGHTLCNYCWVEIKDDWEIITGEKEQMKK